MKEKEKEKILQRNVMQEKENEDRKCVRVYFESNVLGAHSLQKLSNLELMQMKIYL